MTEPESGKVIKIGDNSIRIVGGQDVQPISADLFSEMWVWNGQVHLGFADLSRDGDAVAEARIVGRIRMSLPMAKDLLHFLQKVIDAEMPGPERAN